MMVLRIIAGRFAMNMLPETSGYECSIRKIKDCQLLEMRELSRAQGDILASLTAMTGLSRIFLSVFSVV